MEKNKNLLDGKGENGEWITVKGAHIFVEEGQSVEDAMNSTFKKKNSQDTQKDHKETNSQPKLTLSKEKNNRYDELGKRVTANRNKLKNASPEEKRNLIEENYILMREMDSLWN